MPLQQPHTELTLYLQFLSTKRYGYKQCSVFQIPVGHSYNYRNDENAWPHLFTQKRKKSCQSISMGIVMSVSSLALFESYNYIGAGIASTILFVYPILVAIIMALLFHERLGWLGSICIALAIGGIFMLYQTEDGTTLNIKGVLFVLLSASSYAIYLVYVNHSILKDMATLKLTLYVLIFGLLVYFSISNFGRELSTPSHWYMWFNLLGLAVLPTAISFIALHKP